MATQLHAQACPVPDQVLCCVCALTCVLYILTHYLVNTNNHAYTCSQTSIIHGKILRMGKGFTLEGIVGQDLAELFHQAFARKVRHRIIPPFQSNMVFFCFFG